MADTFEWCIMKFCTKLDKKGHPRVKRHRWYLTAASGQCAQPHISARPLVPGKAERSTTQPPYNQNQPRQTYFCYNIKTSLKGRRFDGIRLSKRKKKKCDNSCEWGSLEGLGEDVLGIRGVCEKKKIIYVHGEYSQYSSSSFFFFFFFFFLLLLLWLPRWSRGQHVWLMIKRSRVRFPVHP